MNDQEITFKGVRWVKKIEFKVNGKKIRGLFISVLRSLFIIGISYVILYPLLVKIANSFKPVQELYDQTVKWIPRNITFEHYSKVWKHMSYPKTFFNTFLLTLMVSLFQLASCVSVGYGLARFNFRAKNIIFALVIFTLVVPPQMILIPMYLNFRYLRLWGLLGAGVNLIGTYWPFILTSLTGIGLKNGLFIYIMRQFFKGMPRDLEEAAYIDGAGLFKAFFHVMLPSAVPGMIIVFLFSFVWQWNDYEFITLFMGGGDFLPQALDGVAYKVLIETIGGGAASELLGSQYSSLINNTGMIMVILPLLLLYTFMQKYFIESVERSGLIG